MSTTTQAPATTWQQDFSRLFQASVERFQSGHQKVSGFFDGKSTAFLASIGYTEQEFFDFVDDFARGGEPTLETALKIAEVRREYFLNEQGGVRSKHEIDMAKLPSKDAQVEGIGWLPRLIPKAEAKLRGEMPADLMYGCGGDRRFFRENKVDGADFLRTVWKAKGDQGEVIAWVKKQRA
jgi:hypothetical protein